MIDLGLVRVLAVSVSYIGGPGYELYVPTELMVTVYETICHAGQDSGLTDAGYYTIDALRIEAGHRAFAAELGPDETPWEAGLGYAMKLEKEQGFIGQAALRRQQAEGAYKRLALFSLERPDVFPWGGEVILRDGMVVGEVSSAGYSRLMGRALVMGYVRGNKPIDKAGLNTGRYELDIAGERHQMTYLARPPYPAR
jgi:4-methylaminobutanoate oxidase (formaldehyde-forming)